MTQVHEKPFLVRGSGIAATLGGSILAGALIEIGYESSFGVDNQQQEAQDTVDAQQPILKGMQEARQVITNPLAQSQVNQLMAKETHTIASAQARADHLHNLEGVHMGWAAGSGMLAATLLLASARLRYQKRRASLVAAS